ncbi:hypothetical protein O3Q51_17020 [Cryomorphaceae bacterium 1068]|nr:hypothetical protein [Cryomorphaceae bacterium 1068]
MKMRISTSNTIKTTSQLLLLFVLPITTTAQNGKSTLERFADYGDVLESEPSKDAKFSAYVLFDWYEDLIESLDPKKIAKLNIPRKSSDRSALYAQIMDRENNYSSSQRYLAQVLWLDRKPSSDCPLSGRVVNSADPGSGLPGSYVDLKIAPEFAIAYSLLSPEEKIHMKNILPKDQLEAIEELEANELYLEIPKLLNDEKLEIQLDEVKQEPIELNIEDKTFLKLEKLDDSQLPDLLMQDLLENRLLQNYSTELEKISSNENFELSNKEEKELQKAIKNLDRAALNLSRIEKLQDVNE